MGWGGPTAATLAAANLRRVREQQRRKKQALAGVAKLQAMCAKKKGVA